MGERAGVLGLGVGSPLLGGGEGLPVTSPYGDIGMGFRPGSRGTGVGVVGRGGCKKGRGETGSAGGGAEGMVGTAAAATWALP